MRVFDHSDEPAAPSNVPLSAWRRIGLALLANPLTHIVTGILVWLADAFIGPPELLFPFLFVVPVILCAWFSNRRIAFALAVILPLGRMWIVAFYQGLPLHPYVEINAAIRASVLLFLAYFVSRSALQERLLRKRVKQLQSILPVCMGCQRIRNEDDHWERLDEYVTEHTQSVVSHTLCPECAQRLYGDVLAQSSK